MITPVETSWTETQKRTLAIAPKLSSFLSMVGSSYIIYHCIGLEFEDYSKIQTGNTKIGDNKRGFRSTMYTRILMALSFCDLVSSLGWGSSTWPIPMDDNQEFYTYNIGTNYTCNAQGFILLVGNLGAACYNTCLSVYFCLLVRNKIDERKKNSNGKILEFIFHFVSLTFPLSTAIFGVIQGYINPTPSSCYISEYPRGCIGDECIRGQHYKRFRVYSTLLPIAICFLIITISMILLYRSVKKLEKQTLKLSSIILESPAIERNETAEENKSKYDINEFDTLEPIIEESNGETSDIVGGTCEDEEHVQSNATTQVNNSNKKDILISQASKKIFRLAILYIAAVLTCWIPVIVRSLMKFFVIDPTINFVSGLLVQILSPLQGFFNAMIYRGFNPLTFLCSFLFSPCSSLLHKGKGSKKETHNCESHKHLYEYEYEIEYQYECYDDEDL